ncbi:hypothetical protein SEA_ANCLAR_66 [Gordonia phage AnClar]|nr:hypothetical protein SEA_ANCLAR_66 [Gordonia phage AnClar]
MSDEPRRWTAEHPDGGRVDVNGTEWFACDPYPTWYRWERGDALTGQLIVGGFGGGQRSPDWPHEDEVREVLTDVLHDAGVSWSRDRCVRTADALLADDRLSIAVRQ